MNQVLKANTPQVVFERIDGEVVLINMESGSYYSLTGTGAVIWELIESGMSTDIILADLLVQYNAPITTIQPTLETFIASLQTENLVVRVESLANEQPVAKESAVEIKQPFEAPILNKYNDMQELLLLDPVHDVDAAGWPNVNHRLDRSIGNNNISHDR